MIGVGCNDRHTEAFVGNIQLQDHRGERRIAFCPDFEQSGTIYAERGTCHTLYRDRINLLDNSPFPAQHNIKAYPRPIRDRVTVMVKDDACLHRNGITNSGNDGVGVASGVTDAVGQEQVT